MSVLKLSDIVASVSASISRGNKYDADIPVYVRKALFHLEREYTFGYMRRYGSVTVNAGVDPPVFTFPHTPIKKHRFVRYVSDADGGFTYLVRADKRQQTSKAEPVVAYFMNSLTEGELDAVLSEAITFEVGVDVFTAQALNVGSPTTAEHDLFDYAEDCVANLTLLKMSHLDNAQELMQSAKLNFDLEVKSLVSYAIEEEEGDRLYVPNYADVLRRTPTWSS